jgi:DNA-binding transcriptional LysR family regulator
LVVRRVRVGDVEPVAPEAVAAQHDADAVAQELADGDFDLEKGVVRVVFQEALSELVVAQIVPLVAQVFKGVAVELVFEDRDVVEGDARTEFVFQAVEVDEQVV